MANYNEQEGKTNTAKVAAAVIGAGAIGAGAAVVMQNGETTDSLSEVTPNENDIAAVDTIPEVEVTGGTSHTQEAPQPKVVHHTVEQHYHESINVNQIAAGTLNIEDNDNNVINIQQPNEPVATAPVQEQTPQIEDVKVEVISVKHDVDISGQKMDVALVDINEKPTLFVDANQDGTSDIFVADVNQNGNIEREEVMDITKHHIPMPTENDIVQHDAPAYSDGPAYDSCDHSDIPDYSTTNDITLADL